jgi:hypothetical protein
MDESLSLEPNTDEKALAEMKEAEAQSGAADFLEIIEETPSMLKLCLHNRNYRGKTKFTKPDITCISIICLIVPIVWLLSPYIAPEDPMLPVILCSILVGILVACGVDDALVRRIIVVDSVRGVMKASRQPFPFHEEFKLDRIKSIGTELEYGHNYTDAYIVISTLVDGSMPMDQVVSNPPVADPQSAAPIKADQVESPPTAEEIADIIEGESEEVEAEESDEEESESETKSTILFNKSFDGKLAAAVASRLNYWIAHNTK